MLTIHDVQKMFNRAADYTFCRKKIALVFVVLALCGVMVVFFRGLAFNAGSWVGLSLTFLPIFLINGLLLSLGIFLIRIYHDEIKKGEASYKQTLKKSWDVLLGASYFSIPFILCYLLLWMFLGLFVLLRETPVLGPFFSVVLAFAPFILNVAALLLCVLNSAMLFFATPLIALRGLNRAALAQTLVKRVREDLFSNLMLALIAALPFLSVLSLLSLAAMLTGSLCLTCADSALTMLQWFFVMIPFTALLTPAVTFFFHFAAEAHVRARAAQKSH